MIKANELRLGNIVRVANLTGTIKNLYSDGEVEMSFSPGYEYIYEDLQPIPLAPELLERCGFTVQNDLYSLKMKDDSVLFVSSTEATAFVSQASIHDAAGEAPCKSLHQLQNLYFALTGEELTINV